MSTFEEFRDLKGKPVEPAPAPDWGVRGCNEWWPGESRFWLRIAPTEHPFDVQVVGPLAGREHWLDYEEQAIGLAEALALKGDDGLEFLRQEGIAPWQPFMVEASYYSSHDEYTGEYEAFVEWNLIAIEWWTEDRKELAWRAVDDPKLELDVSTPLEPLRDDPLPRWLGPTAIWDLGRRGVTTLGELREFVLAEPDWPDRMGVDRAWLDETLAAIVEFESGELKDDLFG